MITLSCCQCRSLSFSAVSAISASSVNGAFLPRSVFVYIFTLVCLYEDSQVLVYIFISEYILAVHYLII